MPTLQIDKTTYFYNIQGSGHPVILIAGFSCDHLLWQEIATHLEKHFQVITFDNRGVGNTIDNNEELTAELLSDDLAKIIDKLKIKKPHIIGASMGGTIALTFASHYKDKTDKLVIINSTSKWQAEMLSNMKKLLDLRNENTTYDEYFNTMAPFVWTEEFLNNEEKIRALKDLKQNSSNPQSIEDQQRQFKILENFYGNEYLNKIEAETLVIYSNKDLLASKKESEKIAKEIKDSKLLGFDTAHGIIEEMPFELSQSIIDFLNPV